MHNLYVLGLLFATLAVKAQSNSSGSRDKAVDILIQMEGAGATDTLVATFCERVSGDLTIDRFLPQIRRKEIVGADGAYRFHLDSLAGPGYLSIYGGSWNQLHPLLRYYFLEPGDQVAIRMTLDHEFLAHQEPYYRRGDSLGFDNRPGDLCRKFRMSFSGKAAAKYWCKYQNDKLNQLDTFRYVDSEGRYRFQERQWPVWVAAALGRVDSLKNQLSGLTIEVLKADLISSNLVERYRNLAWFIQNGKNDSVFNFNLLTTFRKYFSGDTLWGEQIGGQARTISVGFASYWIERTAMEKRVLRPADPSMSVLSMFDQDLKGELHDKVVAVYLDLFSDFRDFDSLLKQYYRIVKSQYWAKVLQDCIDSRGKGALAYNFQLQNPEGNIVRLSDFRGKIVFMDFWFTGCSNCKVLYKNSLSQAEERYKGNKNVVFISISTDIDKFKWRKSISSGQYTSSQAINVYTGGEGVEHPVIKNYRVIGYPHGIIIDREGKIVKISTSMKVFDDFVKNEEPEGGMQ